MQGEMQRAEMQRVSVVLFVDAQGSVGEGLRDVAGVLGASAPQADVAWPQASAQVSVVGGEALACWQRLRELFGAHHASTATARPALLTFGEELGQTRFSTFGAAGARPDYLYPEALCRAVAAEVGRLSEMTAERHLLL